MGVGGQQKNCSIIAFPPLWACCVRHRCSGTWRCHPSSDLSAGDRGMSSWMTPVTEICSQRWGGNPLAFPPGTVNRHHKQDSFSWGVNGLCAWKCTLVFAYLGLTQEVGRVWGKENQNLWLNFCVSRLSSLPPATRRFLENVSFVIREFTPKCLQNSRMCWLYQKVASRAKSFSY